MQADSQVAIDLLGVSIQQGDGLVIRPFLNRLEVSVDVNQLLVGQDLFAVRGHGPFGMPHEGLYVFNRFGFRGQFGPGNTALPHKAVTPPATIFEIGLFATFGRACNRLCIEVESRAHQSNTQRHHHSVFFHGALFLQRG